MDLGGYYIEEESDEDDADACSSSSEDEIQTFVREKFLTKSDSEDDFEQEMEKELSRTVKSFEQKQILRQKALTSGEHSQVTEKSTEGHSKNKAEPSNDDLFYNPDEDDEDEKWVNDQRRACIFPPSSNKDTSSTEKPLPTSDAVLNCPACMTVLCLDCQCHEIYHTQYRAMFVKNCIVDEAQVLRCPPSGQKKRKGAEPTDDPADLFKPVRCSQCNTEVAVYDKDEVYHFFNVIASFS
uniref:Putative e2f-associated phosphoprotein n=1 Tax=Ornithodoros turicata TaxID=34597 RepID=A0A2R5LH35_9ACAR